MPWMKRCLKQAPATLALLSLVWSASRLLAIAPAGRPAVRSSELHPAVAASSHLHAAPASRLNPHLHGALLRPGDHSGEHPGDHSGEHPGDHAGEHRDPAEHLDPADREKRRRIESEGWHRHWHYQWSYAAWAALHRGTGTVQGIAYNAQGVPKSGIRLALRTPSGEYIRNAGLRHVTYSAANGSFVMTGVRLGNYRVRAQEGKTAGHTAISVHAGSSAFVSVKV